MCSFRIHHVVLQILIVNDSPCIRYKGEDSPIPKFKLLKIQCRDDTESLTTLKLVEFKIPIDVK